MLGVAFVEATFIVASSCVRKHSAWSWSTTLQSVGTVAPLRYYRARNLGYVWCTASGSSIKPEGPGVQAICALPCTRKLIMVSVNSSFGNTCSLCWSTRPSTMIMETVIHAEIQSEDETTVNDRATADHVRGCRIAHGCTHLISS